MEFILLLLATIFLGLASFGVSLRGIHFGWLGMTIWLFVISIMPNLPKT